MIKASRMYRMPENNQEVKRFWAALEVFFFFSMQITYPITYFPSNWNILTFFTTFRFASFHFILFCASWVLSCEFTLSKRKKNTSRKRCVYNHGNSRLLCFTYTYMQITVHPPDFAGDKNGDFEFPNDCLFGHPFYFGYHDFIS